MEPKGDAIVISKPVWLAKGHGAKPVHGATVSAQLKGGRLSKPEIALEPAFKNEKPPTWEREKLERMEPVFVAAEKQMQKEE
jgi:hypothetical protein